MGYFNIQIDNDITFLLTEIGHNCKVNNISAKAIINNSSLERTYDDKKIITHEELRRGYYVEYNNLFFIVLNEINDKRYNTYYKAIIRRCNYDIKFVLDGRLYLFYSIIESDKFAIDSGMITTLANTMTVTLPYTNLTKKIKEGTRFIKFGKAWKVTGIDYTKQGLVILHSEVDTINSNTDDIVNEIADKDDLIDTTIIYPFDEVEPEEPPTYNITFNIMEGETIITDATIELRDSANTIVNSIDGIYSVVAGTYTYSVVKEGYITVTVTINVVDEDIIETINLEPEQPQGGIFTIEISGQDSFMVFEHDIPYTATVFNNGLEVSDKDVTFEIDDTSLANIKSQDGRKCIIQPNSNFKFGEFTLKATLVDDVNIFAEKIIAVIGL